MNSSESERALEDFKLHSQVIVWFITMRVTANSWGRNLQLTVGVITRLLISLPPLI